MPPGSQQWENKPRVFLLIKSERQIKNLESSLAVRKHYFNIFLIYIEGQKMLKSSD